MPEMLKLSVFLLHLNQKKKMNSTCVHSSAKGSFKNLAWLTLDLSEGHYCFFFVNRGIIFAFLPYTHADAHSLKDHAHGGLSSPLPMFNSKFLTLEFSCFVQIHPK